MRMHVCILSVITCTLLVVLVQCVDTRPALAPLCMYTARACTHSMYEYNTRTQMQTREHGAICSFRMHGGSVSSAWSKDGGYRTLILYSTGHSCALCLPAS